MPIRILIVLTALLIITDCFGQSVSPTQPRAALKGDTSSSGIIFFENFDDNKNNWTVGNNKKAGSRIDGGVYYLTAVGHAYGEALEVKIDTRKDFEIQARIKISGDNSEHKFYYSMLFWGREAMDGYFFTFAKDGFASVEICNGKHQSDCKIKKGSLQNVILNPEQFNVYTIRRRGRTYSFLVNGKQFYEMPFAPFFGNLVGFGAGRKVSLAVDYLKISYL